MTRLLVFTVCITLVAGKVFAQSLIPFQFTSEEENRLVKETDSVKLYVASGDSTKMVSIDDEASYYKLLGKDRKVIAEGTFITDGDKFLQDGKWIARFENGKIKMAGYYRRNMPIGTWQEYYGNGKLKKVMNYAIIAGDRGELFSCMSGTYQEYFDDGKLKINGFYSAALTKAADTTYVDDPVSGMSVVKYGQHNVYYPEKTSHWEYYTDDGELDKKEDF